MKNYRIEYDIPPLRGIFIVDCRAKNEDEAREAFEHSFRDSCVRVRNIRQIDELGNVVLCSTEGAIDNDDGS